MRKIIPSKPYRYSDDASAAACSEHREFVSDFIDSKVRLTAKYLDELRAEGLFNAVDDLAIGRVHHWVTGDVYAVQWCGRLRHIHLANLEYVDDKSTESA